MEIYDIKVLHMTEPIGIDSLPYFSWKLKSKLHNIVQSAYQIRVMKDGQEIWNTKPVESNSQSFITYEGEALASGQKYEVEILVWNNQGEMCRGVSFFETGLVTEDDWKARWVESTIPRVPVTEYQYGNTAPPVFFARTFMVRSHIKEARLYATSLGVYRLRVNEKRVDDREFAPEFTPYSSTLYYQTYDVTQLLTPGENNLDLYVGDGWYFSLQASPVMEDAAEHPAVLYQLEVTYEDGTREVIYSDGSETCALGPICYSDIFQGEKQDLRIGVEEQYPVEVKEYGLKMLKAQPMPPVRPMKELPARRIFTSPAGELIVDFGQLIAGNARVHIDVPAGQEVTLEYFEILSDEGNYINTMFVPQKDIVISAGYAIDHQVYFTFHGFRYIRVTGMPDARKEDFTGVLLTTEKENAGTFTSSDARLNKLYENIRWSQDNNMMSIPTDCPSREKAGWTGDILIYARAAMMNQDMTPFLTSWLNSVRMNQATDGAVMITAPYTKLYSNLMLNVVKEYGDDKPTGVAGWSDAIVWIPYDMYEITGNIQILRENYESMQKWCDYIIRTAREKRGNRGIAIEQDQYLWNTGFHFGEWLIPSQKMDSAHPYENAKTTAYVIAPFFGYMSVNKFAKISRILGRGKEADFYEDMALRMKHAIHTGIMEADIMPKELMGPYVIAFAFDLVPDTYKEEYKKRLVSLIHQNHDCLDTGFLATPFLLDALCKIGEKELAYQILWQDQQPSWLYEVDHDATAIWEAWDADEAGHTGRFVSFGHYAFGCVDDWICRYMAGIDSDTPGFGHFIIAPDTECKITSCKRSFESEAGEISVAWDKNNLTFTIPCNTTATVTWKGVTKEYGSGSYEI